MSVTGRGPEPMINVAAFHEDSLWTVVLFPRGKHRPTAFHSKELTISPASIDLCGVLVVPLHADFVKLTARDVEAVFEEVTLAAAQFEQALSLLGDVL